MNVQEETKMYLYLKSIECIQKHNLKDEKSQIQKYQSLVRIIYFFADYK